MKRYLLDQSVLLDLLLPRVLWLADATAIWQAHQRGQIGVLAAAFSIPTIYYIMRKQAVIAAAAAAVQLCVNTLEIATTDQNALVAAQAMPGIDFEDNLQIACAVQAGVDGIVTRDSRGFAGAPIPVHTPAALVALLAAPPGP